MAAQLLTELFLNGITGAPSGSVRFYQPQSLIPITVWSNDGASQAITQPVQLDGNGKSIVPVYLTVPARMIVYSSSGAQLMDVERVDGTRAETAALANTLWPTTTNLNGLATAIATSLGGTDGNFKASGTGSIARSVQTKLSETVSVKDFGAKGDAITDDTAAFVAALTYASSISGATVYLPAGTYVVSSTITISVNGASLKGTGALTSIIQNTSASTDCLSVSGNRLYIEDIGISHSTTSTASAINLTTTTGFVTVSRVRTTGHRSGVTVSGSGSFRNFIKDCEIICDGNAGAFGVNNTATTTGLVISQCYIDCGAAAGSGIALFNSTTAGTVMFGNYIKRAATGFALVDSSDSILMGNSANSGGGVTVLYSLTSGNIGSAILGNADHQYTIADASAGSSQQISSPGSARWSSGYSATSSTIAITSAYAVNNIGFNQHHVKATGAATTITISSPTTTPPTPGATISFFLENASGGAVTWAFGAGYRVAAVAPATGTGIGLVVAYNASLAKWTEISRGTAA